MRGIAIVVWVAACGFSGPSLTTGVADAPRADGITAIDARTCPSGYAPLPGTTGSSYRVAGGPQPGASPAQLLARTNWIDAEIACEVEGTHLAIAETDAEHQAFVDVVSGASRWLGVTDRVQQDLWIPVVGGTSWVPHWSGGGPSGSGRCVLLTRVGFMGEEATPCADPDLQWVKGYICECDGHPVDHSAY